MKYNNLHNNSGGYSVIVAVLMIGFLLILTTSTLNLVLHEMQDGKGRQDYMKAYAGAEGALELALFQIKQEGYGYDDDNFQNSDILGAGNKIPKLSYNFDSMRQAYPGSVAPYQSDIIPLFWINNTGTKLGMNAGSKIDLNTDTTMIWNIISQDGGASGRGSFNQSSDSEEKTLNASGDIEYDSNLKIFDILSGEDYLILYNPSASPLEYQFTSDQGFTLPRATITSSAKVGKYTQNLETTVDNTKFLGILKYSIYSGN